MQGDLNIRQAYDAYRCPFCGRPYSALGLHGHFYEADGSVWVCPDGSWATTLDHCREHHRRFKEARNG